MINRVKRVLWLIFVIICTGLDILHAQNQIEIDSVFGLDSKAIFIKYAEHDGIVIGGAKSKSIRIDSSGSEGININNSAIHGIFISKTGIDGIYIERSGSNGMVMESIENTGLKIFNTGEHGISVQSTLSDGIFIAGTEGHAINVEYSGYDGIHVYQADSLALNIQSDKNTPFNGPKDHIGQIYNRNNGPVTNVLALKVGGNIPSANANFITFFDGSDNPLGRIEGDGSGGITLESGGADFAEYLPVHSEGESFFPGDIVGIKNGQIMKNTNNADQVMVLTEQPIVVGNKKENSKGFEKVAFIGQVRAKVLGPVQAGDWIVASNNHDGTGIAVSSNAIRLEDKILGRAWESNNHPGIKKVNVAIGLDHSQAKDRIIQNLRKELNLQQANIEKMEIQLKEIKERISTALKP